MKKRLLVLIVMIMLCVTVLVACDKEKHSENKTESQVESQVEIKPEVVTDLTDTVPAYCFYQINLPYHDPYSALFEGSKLPEEPRRGDVYKDANGYHYTYQQQIGEDEYTPGWNVVYVGNDQYGNDYSGTILKTICGKPVTSMVGCFEGRKAKMDPIVIPEHITDITRIYNNCVRLSEAPKIPASVKKMDYALAGCTRLTGDVVIDANPETYEGCLQGVDLAGQKIEVKGKSDVLEKIKNTANTNASGK
ncbi:MAG: hypothetical protein IJB96_04295 [Lachnospira sp.]|nr:hypothetical protein [Lachnospira sp.]